MAKLTPMMQQYIDLKEEYKDAILFFRLGDFYETFFEDAKTAAGELGLVLTGRDCGLEERAPMCGVPHHALNGYLAKLIEKGYKVAICDQLEDPALAKGLVKRGVTRIVTPGTVIEDSLLTETENNYIASVWLDGKNSGICYCDVSTGEFSVIECTEDIAGPLGRINPREIIAADSQIKKALKMFAGTTLRASFVNPYYDWAYEPKTATDALKKHFKVKKLDAFGCAGMPGAVNAAGALIQYLSETQMNALTHINRIVTYRDSAYMMLDNNAIRNLELTRTIMDGGKKGSLLWLLDKTRTSPGARLLKKTILRPLNDREKINMRLDAVQEIADEIYLREVLIEHLKQIRDLERIIAKISYKTINARDCLALAESLRALPALRQVLEEKGKSALLQRIAAKIDLMEDVGALLDKAIAEDPPVVITEGGIIKEGFDAGVDKLIGLSKNGQQWISLLERKEQEETGIKNLKVRYNKVFGYYIEVTKSYLKLVPYRYKRKQTLVNCERFITGELKEKEEEILGAEDRRKQTEYQIFGDIRDVLEQNIGRMQGCAAALAQLDVLQSFAFVACENNYIRPVITDGDVINLSESRHPVVEKVLKDGFVPNDVYLDRQDRRLLLITGPNMAGKSTYMRQTGLIVLMAHIGCFVPAKKAEICLVDRMFTRVGASDDLAAGESTFMVEMNELAYILNNATEKSLLILDEIGRGTSTIDGLSIAWASIEYILQNLKAKTLFATHYHELVELGSTQKGISNCSVAVKEIGHEIVFLHRIVDGGTDKSFGIEVARLAGLPKTVIDGAKHKLNKLRANEAKLAQSLDYTSNNEVQIPHFASLLEKTDIDSMTPLEALNFIHALKSEMNDELDGGKP